ncbi:MAG: hypothetical protein IJJ43_05125 [Oscillospiraceae bacterium]|nr:hypothetical protein [Oscillospiraceae bacterium]
MTNVEQFFERYNADEALRRRVAEAEAAYPGSLEIRESVVEEVLLPVAAELGLPFTVKELRGYELKLKLKNAKPDVPFEEGEEIEEQASYWLLDRGWEINEDDYKR